MKANLVFVTENNEICYVPVLINEQAFCSLTVEVNEVGQLPKFPFNARIAGILANDCVAELLIKRIKEVFVKSTIPTKPKFMHICNRETKSQKKSFDAIDIPTQRPYNNLEKLSIAIHSDGAEVIDINYVKTILNVCRMSAYKMLKRACVEGIIKEDYNSQFLPGKTKKYKVVNPTK